MRKIEKSQMAANCFYFLSIRREEVIRGLLLYIKPQIIYNSPVYSFSIIHTAGSAVHAVAMLTFQKHPSFIRLPERA